MQDIVWTYNMFLGSHLKTNWLKRTVMINWTEDSEHIKDFGSKKGWVGATPDEWRENLSSCSRNGIAHTGDLLLLTCLHQRGREYHTLCPQIESDFYMGNSIRPIWHIISHVGGQGVGLFCFALLHGCTSGYPDARSCLLLGKGRSGEEGRRRERKGQKFQSWRCKFW